MGSLRTIALISATTARTRKCRARSDALLDAGCISASWRCSSAQHASIEERKERGGSRKRKKTAA
jgi:hypothetical protein